MSTQCTREGWRWGTVERWGILQWWFEHLHILQLNYKMFPANKEPFLNQAHVILVHNWYCSTSTTTGRTRVFTWIHVFCLLSWVLNEVDTNRTGSEMVWFYWYMLSREKHTKFVRRIWWIHVNWARWTREFTYRTYETTGRCIALTYQIHCDNCHDDNLSTKLLTQTAIVQAILPN